MRDVKQVIILRKDLNMRKGKMVAQGAHASMKVILDLMRMPGQLLQPAVDQWLMGSFKKICVSVDNEVDLLHVHAHAILSDIPCSLILDSGKTEFNGIPTHTAVAIGPWWSDEIDDITGKLQLL